MRALRRLVRLFVPYKPRHRAPEVALAIDPDATQPFKTMHLPITRGDAR